MFKRKIIVFTIFIIFLLAVSAVSAAENTDEYLDMLAADEVGAQQVVSASGDEANLTASEETTDTLQFNEDDFIKLYSPVWSDDDLVCEVSDSSGLNGDVAVHMFDDNGNDLKAFNKTFKGTGITSKKITYNDLYYTFEGQWDVSVSYKRAADGKEYIKTGKINFFSNETIESEGTFTDLFNKINEAENEFDLTRDYTFCDGDFNFISGIPLQSKTLVINGNGFTIDGNNQARAFDIFLANVTFNDIRFVNCSSSYSGGAITSMGSDISLIDARFFNNTAVYGGSIYVENGGLSIENSIFANSSSNYAPAIFVTKGDLTISNSKFMNLKANISAGAVAIRSFESLTIENSCFNNTHSAKNGGAVFIDRSYDDEFHGNSLIANVSFVNTSGDFGGAFMQLGGNLEMLDLTFTDCTSKYDGGAAYLSGLNATIANAEFNSNKVTSYDDYPTFGGALYVDNANLTITNSKFIHNSAYEGSGAVGIYDSSYKIINTQFNNDGEAIFAVFKGEGSEIVNLTGSDTVSDDNVFYPYVISGVGRNLTLLSNEIYDVLPARYDLRDYDLTSPVKNQGMRGSCWAVSDIGTLESVLLKRAGLNTTLSANNMQNAMIKYSKYGINYMDEAGYSMLSMAYLLSWLGAIPQENDTFDEIGKISPIMNTCENIHVQDIIILPKDEGIINGDPSIKWAILKYGALSGSILGTASDGDESEYYREDYCSQYVPDEIKADHIISIVGWDDSFSKKNFKITPPGDGAWIIKNSWGTSFGEDGYFYVSYYDKTLCTSDGDIMNCAVAIVLNNTVPYNRNYQYDFVGLNDFNDCTDYMNKYVSVDDDYIAAVGTYFNQSGVDYEVRIEVNGQNVHTQNGVSPYYGYHTIKLNEYVPIKKGDNFSVIISSNAFPFSGLARTYYNKGVSFALCNGEWIDVYDEWDMMTACIKVYTIDEIPKEKQDTAIAAAFDSANYALTVKLTNGDAGIPDADIAVNVAGHLYSAKTDYAGQATVSVADLAPGTYTAEISYAGDDAFNPSKTLLDISFKANTAISLVYEGTARMLVATLTNNATGDSVKGANVVFTIKTKSYNVKTDLNGQAKLITLNLGLGENTATATYNGNVKYNPSTTTINFTN
ncbi:C1 family peptidase, partial [Methanobrevibacter sp.]|uniref:C1 family peptidase n=1 Tax=Methanobrevibacter sp. TaxID=66852 RepID=UPI0038688D49